jgi:hypothetical protein
MPSDLSLFDRIGDTLTAESEADLRAKLDEIDPGLPPGSGEDASNDRKRFALRLYLFAQAQHGLLRFPLTITRLEMPDFRIEQADGAVITVQHGDATPGAYQRLLSELEGQRLKTVMRAALGGKPVHWDRSTNLPDLTRLVGAAVLRGFGVLNAGGYAFGDRNELIVYAGADPPIPDRDYEAALVAAREKLVPVLGGYEAGFDAVSATVASRTLYYDFLNGPGLIWARWTWREEKAEESAA